MPAAVPLLGAVVSGGLAASSGATIFGLTGLSLGFAVGGANIVLGLASSALTPKPKVGNLSFTAEAGSRTHQVRQPIIPRRVVQATKRVLAYC